MHQHFSANSNTKMPNEIEVLQVTKCNMKSVTFYLNSLFYILKDSISLTLSLSLVQH